MKREIKEIIVILVIFGIILAGVAISIPFIQHDDVCANCSVNYTTPNEALENNNT